MRLNFLWPRRRRHWLVARSYQLRFLIRLSGQLTLIFAAAAMASLLLALRLGGRIEAFLTEHDALPFLDEVEGAWRLFALLVLAVVGVVAVLTALAALVVSHWVAGPTTRLQTILREMGAGNTSQRVVFRRRDRLGALAEAVNRRAQAHDELHARLKADIPFLASSVQSLRAELEGDRFPLNPEEVRRLEASVRAHLGTWKREKALAEGEA